MLNLRFRAAAALIPLSAAAGLACAPTAGAAPVEIAGAHYDDAMTVGGETLTLNGAGLRKIVFFKVYAAGLYLPASASTLDEATAQPGARRVRLTLLRNVSGGDFIEALDEGLRANLSPEGAIAIDAELKALKAIMSGIGDVKEGDRVDFDFIPTQGTIVLRNGSPVGAPIAGQPLYDAVLAIWLGEKPIDETLKSGMLGLKP